MEISNQEAQTIITAYERLYGAKLTNYQTLLDIHNIRRQNLEKNNDEE